MHANGHHRLHASYDGNLNMLPQGLHASDTSAESFAAPGGAKRMRTLPKSESPSALLAAAACAKADSSAQSAVASLGGSSIMGRVCGPA